MTSRAHFTALSGSLSPTAEGGIRPWVELALKLAGLGTAHFALGQ